MPQIARYPSIVIQPITELFVSRSTRPLTFVALTRAPAASEDQTRLSPEGWACDHLKTR